jgi:hypothetical protein
MQIKYVMLLNMKDIDVLTIRNRIETVSAHTKGDPMRTLL